MGKSPGKWIKTVLFGKKSSKTTYNKGRENVANAKEVLVAVRASETDVAVAPALPVSSHLNPYANERDERKLELENEEAANISNDDGISLPVTVSQDIDSQKSTLEDSEYDPERMKQKQAATVVQAAFRGYLARRAFVALKGIIRLQALIRGHLVRRQAITTLCCMMGIVKLQAHARGVIARRSDGGLEVQKICNQMNLRESKPVVSLGVNVTSRIGKLSANAFVHKLVASSLPVMPLRLLDDAGDPNSAWNWLERWSASCFWKPIPQPKKASDTKMRKKQANGHVETDIGRSKLSVRRIRSTNLDGTSVQATSELDKPKRNMRKVSSHPAESSVEENPQNVLEKVKRNLRKVHNPVVESSVQSEVEFDKPKQSLEKVSSATNLDIAEQGLNSLSEKTDKETALTVNSSAGKLKNEMATTVNSSTEEMRREMTTRNSSAEKMNKETSLKINCSAEKMNKEKASKISNSAEKMRQETDTANASAEKMKKETALTVNSLAEKVKKETALTIDNSAEKIRQEAYTVNSSTEKVKKEAALTVNSSAEKVKKEITASLNGTAEKLKKQATVVNSSAEKMKKEATVVNSPAEKMKKEATVVNNSVEKMKKEATVVNSSAEKMKKETASAVNILTEKAKKETALPVTSSAEKVKKEIASTVNGSAEKMKKETALAVNSSADTVKRETAATVNGSAQKTKKDTTMAVSKSPDSETMLEPFGMNETSDLFHAESSAVDSKPSIDRTVKDENSSTANVELNRKDDSTNENQKSGRKASSPAVPSYMAATESAKAKLRLQGSPQSTQDGTDKNNLTRRQSLPFSANSKISSQSPRTQRLVHSEKEGSKSDRSLSSRDKNAKAAQVEWKR